MADTHNGNATAVGGPPGAWWWMQIPAPLRTLVATVACLAFLFPLTLTVLDEGAKLSPYFLIAKNWIWPAPKPAIAEGAKTLATEPPARLVVPGVFEGYAYYEVGKDGQPTNDGQLKPASGGAMPKFSDIFPGQTFKTISPVNIRTNPNSFHDWDNPGFNTILQVLGGNQCLKVVDGERREYPVRVASSGGFLPVIRVSC